MPDLRKDPIVGRWVIIAKNRAKRPHEFLDGAIRRSASGFCPFCEGNERHTTGEIAAYRQGARTAIGRAGACAWCPTSFRRSRSKAT